MREPAARAASELDGDPSRHAPAIASVGRALPPHRYEQHELVAALGAFWDGKHHNVERLARLHEAVQVGGRNLALPLEGYLALTDFGKANDAFLRVGLELGEQAVRRALDGAGLAPEDVDALFFTTVTGLATPTIDARLVDRLGLRRDVRRTPMFGLGCVGGAAGVARMSDYLVGHPDHVAVLLSVELCSLTLQRDDFSIANLIATGLFGDGAAAVVGIGARRATRSAASPSPSAGARSTTGSRPRVVATRSVFYPRTEHIMGWNVRGTGFEVVLSADLAPLVESSLAPDVDAFLAEHGLARRDVAAWIAHPGGPKIVTAMERALGLPEDALAPTRRSLTEVGNLSSASVLFVLGDHLEQGLVPRGASAMLLAMGPGFCAELVLLRG